MLTAILLILGLIFLFFMPPLGIVLLILGCIALILKLVKGTGKALAGTGSAAAKLITEKPCPFCRSKISARAVVCPVCHRDLA